MATQLKIGDRIFICISKFIQKRGSYPLKRTVKDSIIVGTIINIKILDDFWEIVEIRLDNGATHGWFTGNGYFVHEVDGYTE